MSFTEYEDKDELRKLQLVTTMVLGEFDRVCKQLSIPYFIYGGTAIGAVRHGGFIPWDDDIDVAMFRSDYERFMAEAPAVLGDDYGLVDYKTECDYPACDANLVLKGTLCVPEEFDKCKFQYPIGIGVYAFDKLSDNPRLRKRQLSATWFWARLAFLCGTPCPHLSLEGWKRGFVLSLCYLGHGLLKVFHISPTWIHSKWEKAATAASDEPDGLFVDFTDRSPIDWGVHKEEVFPLKEIAFEDLTVSIPRQYDAILRRGYGDYMQLPAEDNRKNHHPSKLDFGRF